MSIKIRVQFSRDENIGYYNAPEAVIDLDEYVWGVVASEVGNTYLESCKAMAVAVRTNAMVYVNSGKPISDLSTKVQAFRSSRLTNQYSNARQAAEETSGLVLYCNGKLANPASFSSNNGGRTVSSQERWGGARSWLIAQDDPWDSSAVRTGHGVGLSQRGSSNMAKAGKTFTEILSFYYPTTCLHNVETNEDVSKVSIEGTEGSNSMATTNTTYATVQASWLIDKFKFMVDNGWKYVTNSARYGEVDCSGAFSYWYKQAGSYMYHGSNTMWRKYTTKSGKIGSIDLVPGMAVFKWRNDGKEPASYVADKRGNYYHVGLYIGDGKVAEAKGSKSGCIYSNVNEWTHCARLKYTEYDVTEGEDHGASDFTPITGVVTSNASALNYRAQPSADAKIIGTIPKGTRITIIGEQGNWWKTNYNKQIGWVTKNFITLDEPTEPIKPQEKKYIFTVYMTESDCENMKEYLTKQKIAFELKESDIS